MTVNVVEAYKIFKDSKEFWPPVSVCRNKKLLWLDSNPLQVWRDISVDFGRAHYIFPGFSVHSAVAVHRYCYRVCYHRH